MNPSLLSKIFGWGQFLFSTLGQVFMNGGLPTNPLGWVMAISSLGAAIGIHAAGKTDGDTVGVGTPPKP